MLGRDPMSGSSPSVDSRATPSTRLVGVTCATEPGVSSGQASPLCMGRGPEAVQIPWRTRKEKGALGPAAWRGVWQGGGGSESGRKQGWQEADGFCSEVFSLNLLCLFYKPSAKHMFNIKGKKTKR